jgi:hypothetical protein
MAIFNDKNSLEQSHKYKLCTIAQVHNAGFTMPIALGMGCLMMLFSASMINRSDSDRQTTNSYRQADRALTAAEAGVIRVQSFLDRYPLLATYNLDRWVDTLNQLPQDRKSCGIIDLNLAKDRATLHQSGSWINLDDRHLDRGRYRVIDYQYRHGIGKLTVAGEVGSDPNSISNNTIAVDIPIGSQNPPPALWVNSLHLSENQRIQGDVRAVICPQISAKDLGGLVGIDRVNLTQIQDRFTGKIIADPFTQIPPTKKPPNNAVKLPAITSSIQLPRPRSVDTPDNNEYHYIIEVDNRKSGHSIKLKNTDHIEINVPENQKVNLYLKGDIDLAGSKTINVNQNYPNLRIYGGTNTKKLTIQDNASITALIHAPFAHATSIHSNELGTGIIGVVWVNSWDSYTHRSQLSIAQAGTWKDFEIEPAQQPPHIYPIVSWQRNN